MQSSENPKNPIFIKVFCPSITKFRFDRFFSVSRFLRGSLQLRRSALITVACILSLQFGGQARAAVEGSARFTWDPVADPAVAGYRVHWGTASGAYTKSADAGNVTALDATGFTEGVTYYAAVMAYGNNGELSAFSTELSFVYSLGHDIGLPADATGDPDQDGISNLMEYALKGGDSALPNPGILPKSSVLTLGSANYLALTVEKNPTAAGVGFVVESSSDLVNWGSGLGHTVVVTDTPDILVVRDFNPIGASPGRFLRLRVDALSP